MSSCLSSLEKKSLLRDNVDLLVSLADVYFRAGDTKNAILKFEQAQMLDPYLIKGVLYLFIDVSPTVKMYFAVKPVLSSWLD